MFLVFRNAHSTKLQTTVVTKLNKYTSVANRVVQQCHWSF